MKNKALIITMIILLSIIVIILIGLLYSVISGNHKFLFKFNNGKRSENIIYDESYDSQTINNIEISSSAGNVNFEESIDGKIRVVAYGDNNEKLKVNNTNNELKIDHIQKNTFFMFNKYINDIIVYIPKNYDKTIEIDLDYGNVNVVDLENATINIKEDCGNIILGKIKNVTIKDDYGNVEIAEVLNKLNIKSDCGDINIDKIELKEDSTIKCDLGDVKIGETNNIFIDTDVDLGDVKVNTNNRHSGIILKVEVDCGNIKVDN